MENPESTPEIKEESYITTYMRNRYRADPQSARAYRNSLRYKKRYGLAEEDFEKYGKHLADIVKLKQIVETLPPEFVKEIVQHYISL